MTDELLHSYRALAATLVARIYLYADKQCELDVTETFDDSTDLARKDFIKNDNSTEAKLLAEMPATIFP